MGVGSEITGEIAQEMIIERVSRNRGLSAASIGAFIGGVIGMFCGNYYVRNKLIPFNNEVAQETKQNLLSRPLAGLVNNTSSADSAMPDGAFDRANSLKRIDSKNYPFARFVYNSGGQGIFGLIGGAIGAAIGGLIGYALKGKKQEELPQPIVIYPSQAARVTAVRPQEAHQTQHQEPESEQWRNRDAKQRETQTGNVLTV